MRFKTLLIDDEELALDRLARLLTPHAETIEVIGRVRNGLDAVEQIDRLKPDLIFLDIQMPELDGFQVLEEIEHLPWIIFCTAYDQYALKAFNTNSIDYLLKPVEPERLTQGIQKLQRLTNSDKEDLQSHLHSLLSSLKQPSLSRIKVTSGNRILLLRHEDICFFHAEDKYVEVHTFDHSYLITQSLSQLEVELPSDTFVRIHRSTIINLNYLEEIFKWFGGQYRVRLRDNNKTELDVSRSLKSRLGI